MKATQILCSAALLVLGFAGAAEANYCSFDVAPSATLLFPFVAYDYEGGYDGLTTLISITNVSSEAQVIHIEFWTDLSVPIFDFNIVLTGYDVIRMNMRDILGFGLIPTSDTATDQRNTVWQQLVDATAPYYGSNAGGEPFDDGPYSNHNALLPTTVNFTNLPDPQPAGTYPLLGLDMRCNPYPISGRPGYIASPINYVDPVPQSVLDYFEGFFKASQTAAKSYVDCAGAPYDFPADPWFVSRDDGPVWFYITADVIRACNKDNALSSTTYFNVDRANSEGALDNNVLVGDVIWLDSKNRFSEADHAIHLESDRRPSPAR